MDFERKNESFTQGKQKKSRGLDKKTMNFNIRRAKGFFHKFAWEEHKFHIEGAKEKHTFMYDKT